MAITPTGDRDGALAAFGIQAGPQAGEEVPIRSPVVTIGRGNHNDIIVPDDSVSGTHARVEFDAGAWRITDLESTNGTFVEGVRLSAGVPTPLAYGSSVRLGAARLHFRAVEEADPEAARADYSPPPRRETVRERKSGFRLPVWVMALIVILLILAVLVFGWIWTQTTAPPPVPTAAGQVLSSLPPPVV